MAYTFTEAIYNLMVLTACLSCQPAWYDTKKLSPKNLVVSIPNNGRQYYCQWLSTELILLFIVMVDTELQTRGGNDDTVKILKIGTPEIITIIVLQLEQLDFTVQYCVQKMQTE